MKTKIFLFILGTPFLVGGIVILWTGIETFSDVLSARNWEQVPVKVSELKVVSSSDGDGTTYSVKARYNYEYNGKKYTGKRFAFTIGKDNFLDHDKFAFEVEQRHPPYGFLNPENPSEAVLYRKPTGISTIFIPFGLVFFIVGVGLVFGSIFSAIGESMRRSLFKNEKAIRPKSLQALTYPITGMAVTSFALVFLNGFILIKLLSPVNCLYLTFGLIILGFLAGFKGALPALRRGKLTMKIENMPGSAAGFSATISGLQSDPMETSRGKRHNAEIRIVKTVYYKDSDNAKRENKVLIGSMRTKVKDHFEGVKKIKLDPETTIKYKPDVPEKQGKLAQKLAEKKNREIRKINLADDEKDLINNVKTAFLSGKDASKAAADVLEMLEENDCNIIIVIETIYGEAEFPLPIEAWKENQPASFDF